MQRLIAAGAVPVDDPDPLLVEDSDLSKTAGMPMVLTCEFVSDRCRRFLASSCATVAV